MRLSRLYAAHDAEISAMMAYIQNNGAPTPAATRLGITPADIAMLLGLQSQWNAAYSAYRSPATHNAIAVEAMKTADDKMLAAVKPLRKRVKYGTAALTAEDYAQLTIHRDKETRTPAQKPIEEPVPVFVHFEPLNLTFEAKQQTAEGIHRRGLPRGYRVARMLAVLPPGAEPSDADFRPLDTIGRSRFTITFADNDIGKYAHLRIAYENTAGRGPFSHSVKAPII